MRSDDPLTSVLNDNRTPIVTISGEGVAMTTRGRKRKVGQRDVWDLIVNNDDVSFKHILPRLNSTDLKFLHLVNGETRKLIKRSSREEELKKKFKVEEMSSISTLEVAWEHKSLWPSWLDETYFSEKYCVANECPMDLMACARAAQNGHLECLKYLREEVKEPWYWYTATRAAKYGHLHILEYLVERKFDKYNESACMLAAESGHLDCLKYLHETAKAPWDSEAVRLAHKNNQTECKSFFIFLSIGTIASIGISCAAEEYILKRIEGFHHYWFLALFELVVFSVMTFVWMMITTDNEGNGDVKDFGSNTNGVEDVLKSTATPTKKKKSSSFMHHEYYSRIVPPLKAPIHLYVASASLIGIYTSLGKVSYKYINYATGTVLKSSKLIPVILLSSVWLKRTYHWLDYLACVLLVIASCSFALGEHEGNKQLDAEDPTLYAFGFFLSFFCVCVGAVQSNVVDKALRDYEATVSENMLMTNSIGALLVFVVVLVKEPDAFAFFFGDWFYLSLITFRSIVFWLGAVFYTTLVKHFGAVPAVAITTCRKVLTVISSFVFFSSDKPFGVTYFVALVFFSGAVACEFFKHNTKTKSQQLEMARKDSDVEKHKSLWPRHWDETYFSEKVARTNKLELLEWAREEKKCRWDEWTINMAAEKGNLEMVKYCVANECPMDLMACARAAQNGHLECLKYLREEAKAPWYWYTATRAAKYGHLHILEYLVERKFDKYNESACRWAAMNGHFDCLKYLHETAKAPWNYHAVGVAHRYNQTECEQYLLDNNCPLPPGWRQSPGDWEEIYGEETPETPYYVHRKTRETTWTKPEYLAWTRVEHDWKEEEDGNEEEKKEDKESVPEEGASKKKGSWFSSKS
ncbi:unnamed protein product [Bathycoccus prasinos]